MLCKLAYFYGYKLDELAEVPKRTLDVMWECITMIEAQEQLKLMTALDWPNMKKDQRHKLHRELHRQAYPNNIIKKDYITIDHLQQLVGK